MNRPVPGRIALLQVTLIALVIGGIVLTFSDPLRNAFRSAEEGAAFSETEGGEAGEDRGEGPHHQLELESWFYGQRAYPSESVPAFARLIAWRAAKERVTDLLEWSSKVHSTQALGPWRSIGPAPISGGSSGRVPAIAVDPKNPNVVYAGAAQGGIWKSTDAGSTWKPLTDDQPSLASGSIAIDPVNPNMIYVGTGEATFSALSYYGAGILRSTDAGASWTQLGAGAFARRAISRLVIDPTTAGSSERSTIYASSTRASSNFTRIEEGPAPGVFVSRDSGQTWTLLKSGTATDLVMDPLSSNRLYTALSGAGIFKTEDRGANWMPLTDGLPETSFGRISLAVARTDPRILFASYEDRRDQTSTALLQIYKTTDGGTTWRPTARPTSNCQCFYDNFIGVDPADAQMVYWGGVQLFRSTDGGGSWSNITRNIHVDQHIVAFGPATGAPGTTRTLYAGNDGGVWKSTNSGGNWTSANAGMAITQFIGVASHPTNPDIAFGGTQDNGTLKYEGRTGWREVFGCDGGHAVVDISSPNTVYATTQSNGCSRVARSDFSGTGFLTKTRGILISMMNGFPDGRALFYAPLEVSRMDPRTLYYGSYRVYRTTDRGDNWAPISPDLTGGERSGPRPVITTLGPGPGPSLYVGTGDGRVHASFDGGITWRNLTKLPLPNRFVTRVFVDPASSQIAYATFSGFNDATPATPGHVFRTVNGGAVWADISNNLPNVPVNAIVVDPGSNPAARTVYLGTDIGVYMSSDGGRQWVALNKGLPNVAVLDLELNTATNILRVATHGRGIFDLANIVQIDSFARRRTSWSKP